MRKLLLLVTLSTLVAVAGMKLSVGNPIQHGRLTIFPVFGPASNSDTKYLTLDEGLESGAVAVGELGTLSPRMVRGPMPPAYGGGAQVNELALINRSDRPLLLLAGEIVSGGHQDRVVGKDHIVPAHSEPVMLGVFCVEHGRWTGPTSSFSGAKLMAHPELRKQAAVGGDQHKVWDEVASNRAQLSASLAPPAAAVVQAESGTSYAKTANAAPVAAKIQESAQTFLPQLPPDAIGVVVAVDGKIIWADVFSSPALFKRYRAKLLQSYVVQVYGGKGMGGAPTTDAADSFLTAPTGHQTIDVEPGLYPLIRSESAGLVTYELEDGAGTRLHYARCYASTNVLR